MTRGKRASRWLIARRVATVPVFLVLGMAGSIGVAWMIARTAPEFDDRSAAAWSATAGSAWLYSRGTAPSAVEHDGVAVTARAARAQRATSFHPPPRWSVMFEPPETNQFAAGSRVIEEGFGWPWPVMACAHIATSPGPQWLVRDGIPIGPRPREPSRQIALPLRPIWTALSLSAVFYGVIMFMIWLALRFMARLPLRIRRRRRIKRGQCAACGYSFGAASIVRCPECGRARELV